MSQSRRSSLAEALVNVVLGFGISLTTNYFLFPALGLSVPFGSNVLIVSVFTILSIARTYIVRRAFNYRHSLWLQK